ncbi:acyltransferase domain-containing protein [Streptomyces sp. NBC_00083]|uniref:acyltransferase domain-containing protein n=1 Tax=Streptomyces sp. NBC_00083 TaxID=2975647 RepID=UPI0022532853|nr:acyltransferase domain-containing protein [Streptomyces sp. NBC_00083]MCX5383091.1 acyltransferase domain-containing protein [Streptomyces sp. NBC_00083]
MLLLDDLPETLLDLAVPHEDINELTALAARFTAEPELAGLLERSVLALVEDIGTIGGPCEPPPLPKGLGDLERWFPVYVTLAALPYTRAYHRERGIPEDIARRTLADLGRHIALHRRRRGNGGLNAPHWLRLHFRGELYQLGRLQFQRARLGERTSRAARAAGVEAEPGDPCLNLHIPDCLGPLTPRACADSVARARTFFARHFPEERFRVATCHSWLLDEQLRDHLPESSNILRFQRLFRTAYRSDEQADGEPVGFVFGDPRLPVADLPQRTSVQRAVTRHLLNGGHWYLGHGWFEL